MDEFERILRETEHRYRERITAREDLQHKIHTGRILEADEPRRVALRLKHLGVSRAAATTLVKRGTFTSTQISAAALLPPDPVTLERVLGNSELVGIAFLERGVSTSRTVARVRIKNTDRRVLGYATGFMVSPHLLLTNHHVLHNQADAQNSDAEFNYQIGVDGQPSEEMSFGFSPDAFFLTDQNLDYTIVAVNAGDREQELRAFGWNQLVQEEGRVIKGERLNIIQHPNGEPKQLALRENQLVDVLDDFLHYRTDTAPGSSGSPVLNDQWEVIALHHSGVPRRDSQGQILTRDGQVWHYPMDERQIDWIANEGIRVSRIVQHARAQSLTPDQQRLLAEMIEAQSTATGLVEPKPAPGDSPHVPAVIRTSSPTNQTAQSPISAFRVAERTDSSGRQEVDNPQPMALSAEDSGSDDLQLALQEMEKARSWPYYIEEADIDTRESYYSSLNQASTPQDLFANLSALVRSTHTHLLGYNPSLHLYPWVDLRPDRTLRSIYSQRPHNPEEFVREDSRFTRDGTLRVHDTLIRNPKSSDGHPFALIRAQSPYNCEHAVPQPWFDGQDPMCGDLHHLFTCEKDCRDLRGSSTYSDSPDSGETTRTACGLLSEQGFEPAAGKGVVARATLYFLLRYPGIARLLEGKLDPGCIATLLDWHERFPITVYEKHRNAAIFEKQGNRNPLIDFPKIARGIDFTAAFAS